MKLEQDFIRLIQENERIIWKICRYYSCVPSFSPQTAEDLFQEIVLNIWKSYPKYIQQENCKTSTWIYRIALNVAVSSVRRHSPPTVPIDEADVDYQLDDDESTLTDELYKRIGKLREDEKALLLLFLEDLPYVQIAEIIGISVSNVGTKIQRIKNKIRRMKNE